MTTQDDAIERYGKSVFWGTLAAGGLLIGALVAILAGFLLGHYTHVRTKTVAERTMTQRVATHSGASASSASSGLTAGATVNLPAAVAFYLVYIAGVLVLGILPNKDAGLGKTARTGALLGAFAYATYDLTNQATLKVWATHITVLDLTWGAFVTAAGATAGYFAVRLARV